MNNRTSKHPCLSTLFFIYKGFLFTGLFPGWNRGMKEKTKRTAWPKLTFDHLFLKF